MKLIKTRFNGVYYRESTERTYNGKPDRCFYIKYYKHKKQVQEVVGWLSEGYTAQVAVNKRSTCLTTTFKPDDGSITFAEAFDYFLEWAKVNKKTWQSDIFRYKKHIAPYLGHMHLKDISSTVINDLIIKMKNSIGMKNKTLSPQTVKHHFNLIRRVINFAKETDRFNGENPANTAKVKMEKFDNTRLAYLTDDEVGRIVEICKTPRVLWEIDAAFILFALYTGFRRGELFNLKWSDVDTDKHIAYLVETKGKVNQTIILSDISVDVLKTLPKIEDYIFPSKRGGKRDNVNKLWKRVKQLANVRPDIRFHDVRHTFGTMAVTAGVPLDVLQKIMTHKDIKTTQRYAHIVDKRLHDAADAIDTAFKGLSPAPACAGDEVKSRAKKRKIDSK